MKNTQSSKKVSDFLEKNSLHKKDFAQMIGVTLSYVYNIIDENIPFSTRSVTIERIATVMDILPEDFEEYVIEEDPTPYCKNLAQIKTYMQEKGYKTVEYLKFFERKKRLKIVDILRGKDPLPIDYHELCLLLEPFKLNNDEIFSLWKDIFIEHLNKSGFEIEKNKSLLDKMTDCAKEYFNSVKIDKCNIS